MQGTSYTVQDFIDFEPHEEVWPENWDVIWLYERYATQWRVGPNGVVALDMNVFHHELTRKKVPEAEYDRLIDQLAIVEGKALQMIIRNSRK